MIRRHVDCTTTRAYAQRIGAHSGLSVRPSRAVLVVGHPGHELRVYGWLADVRPVVHVVTDGSGSDGVSRVGSTSALLDGAGACRGLIYGRMSDREIYAAILAAD